jgi:hypothetical protein
MDAACRASGYWPLPRRPGLRRDLRLTGLMRKIHGLVRRLSCTRSGRVFQVHAISHDLLTGGRRRRERNLVPSGCVTSASPSEHPGPVTGL